jgi:hypothetical protein
MFRKPIAAMRGLKSAIKSKVKHQDSLQDVPHVHHSMPDRLNFGCGYDKRDGYLNVDVDAACQPDVLLHGDPDAILPNNHFVEIVAKDVLEHIPRAQSLSALLGWAALLKMGGSLILETSSILGVARQFETRRTFADHYGWTICLFGNQVHHGDFHHTGFTELTLQVHLLASGFSVKHMEVRDEWMFLWHAEKIMDWTETLRTFADANDGDFINAAYRVALNREVTDPELTDRGKRIAAGRNARRDVLKEIFSSHERLMVTATQNGL